jgi:hypothetical protein
MIRAHNDGDRAGATDLRICRPVEIITGFDADQFGRVWTTLFGRCAGPPG